MTRPTRVYRAELARELGIPVSTVKYYSELGIFPFVLHKEDNQSSNRFYDIKECRKIWDKVQGMKAKGMSMGKILTEMYHAGQLNMERIGEDKTALLDILLRNGG